MMSRPRAAAAIAAVGLAATFSIAAHAPEGCYVALEGDPAIEDDDVFACEQQTWFHAAETPATTVAHLDPTGTHGVATFDTSEPAGSVTGGNGAGYFNTQAGGLGDQFFTAQFDGSFTGVIDRVDVDLHTLGGVRPNPTADLRILVDIAVIIDGTEVLIEEVYVDAVPEESSSAGAQRLDFAITGLASRLAALGVANDETTEHEVTLVFREFPTISGTLYVFDTTEVPGGITFNPPALADGTAEFPA